LKLQNKTQNALIMCIFSSEVKSVSKTQIFARRSGTDKQFLVYRMDYEANRDLAMILPLPTPPMSPEDAVRFIDLSGYPEFFEDMNKGFEILDVDSGSKGMSRGISRSLLKVKEVGNFEASFVPSLQDFDRLDPRFCLSKNTWRSLPRYEDYGFAVFKLKPGKLIAHPMAFEFPTRFESTLFFPTVHVHDGQVELFADFDHALYLQSHTPFKYLQGQEPHEDPLWIISEDQAYKLLFAKDFLNIPQAKGIVDGELVIYRQLIKGKHPNIDNLVKAS
jgi:hypothetical protein